MLRDCMKLVTVLMLRSFGINEMLHTKDSKKKINAIMLLFSFGVIGISIMIYAGLVSFSLCIAGMSSLIPAYILASTSMIILVFTIFKSSSVLFGARDYEQLIALPLTTQAIVASRFLSMYLINLLLASITMLPGALAYAIFIPSGFGFWFMIITSLFFIPLIPMTIATSIGVLVTAVASRMKHKTLFTVVFSFAVTIAIFVLSMSSGQMNQEMFADLFSTLSKQIYKTYPFAAIYTSAIIDANILSYFAFILLSVLLFILFVAIVAWKYIQINSALSAHSSKRNYVMTELETSSPLISLYKKELRRYFSSPLYILNTGIGYLMMIIMSGAIFFVGTDKLETTLSMPGASQLFLSCSPLILGAMVSIMSTTTASISLEGKQWWIAQSLPVKSKTIFDSKIMVNLTISVPSLLISSTLLAFSIPSDLLGCFLLYAIPLAYSLFVSVLGITVNATFPVFSWDNEAYVIKQSSSTFFAMLIGIISIAIPFVLAFTTQVPVNLILILTFVFLLIVTALLYITNNHMRLKMIQESR